MWRGISQRQSGNAAGTRAGSKHRVTKLAEALLDG
jgi:hypothetical protein